MSIRSLLGLRQNGYIQLRDANGNLQLGSNRWVRYDYENRSYCGDNARLELRLSTPTTLKQPCPSGPQFHDYNDIQ